MLVHAFICLFIHLIRVGRVPPTRHDSGQECTQMAGPSTLEAVGACVLSGAVWLVRGFALCNSSGGLRWTSQARLPITLSTLIVSKPVFMCGLSLS